MSEILSLDHVSLQSKGATLTMSVAAGQSMCVVGPGASGKSRLLATISKLERPVRGTVHAPRVISVAGREDLPRRSKPMSIAKTGQGAHQATRAAEVLTALRLWDLRQKPISQLSESQVAACELIQPLTSDAELIVIDGYLDRLDPWALKGALDLLRTRLAHGAVAVVATNRPDLIETFDAVVVLKDQAIVFAGSPVDLRRKGPEQTIEVATERMSTVRALIAPFEVSVREVEEGVLLRAAEGQSIAARLLLEGYGDVKFVYIRKSTLAEALLSLD